MSYGFVLALLAMLGLGALLYSSGGPSAQPGLVISIALLALFAIAIFWSVRSRRRRLRCIADVLDGDAVKFKGGVFGRRRALGRFHGREAALMLIPGAHQPGYLVARLACACTASFHFWRPASMQLGRPKDRFETGNMALDRDFRFRGPDAQRVRRWLLQPDNAARVAAMLRRGLRGTTLDLTQDGLSWAIQGPEGELAKAALLRSEATASAGQERLVEKAPRDPAALREYAQEALEELSGLADALEKM
jgi:MYXO-CTERM domain-containing protein